MVEGGDYVPTMYIGEKSLTPSMGTTQRSGRSMGNVGAQEYSIDTMNRLPSEDAVAEIYTQELMQRLVYEMGQGEPATPAAIAQPEESESPAVVGRVIAKQESAEFSEKTMQRNFSVQESITIENDKKR